MKIKSSQIHNWDHEPADEGSSAFQPTTGYSSLSGFRSTTTRPPTSGAKGRLGLKSLVVFCAILLAIGMTALLRYAHLLRAH